MIKYGELLLFYLDDCSIADSLAPSACSNLVDQDNHTIQSKRIFPPPHKMLENKGKTLVAVERSPCLLMEAEMEFLDTSLTKYSSLLIHSILSPVIILADFKENHTLLWL